MVYLEFIQSINPIAGIVVLQFALDRRMVKAHNRNQAVSRLTGSDALADFLKNGGRPFDIVLRTNHIFQFGTRLLVCQMDIGLKLLYKSFADLCRHSIFSLTVNSERDKVFGNPG